MTKSYDTKDIEEATAEEINAFAQGFLGIPTEGLSDGEIKAKVTAANEGTKIHVRVVAEPVSQAGSPPPKVAGSGENHRLEGGLGRSDPKVRLLVHAEENEGVIDDKPLSVGVNGVFWNIQPGHSVEVPYRVYEALRLATRTVVRMDGKGNTFVRDVPAAAYSVEYMPPQAEIDAWAARVGDKVNPA